MNSAIDTRLEGLRLQLMASAAAKTVGTRIRMSREAMNLTQRAFAAKFGDATAVTGQHISNWERGVNQPSERYMDELERITGRPRAWFYTDPSADPAPDLTEVLSPSSDATRLEARIEDVAQAVEKLLAAQAAMVEQAKADRELLREVARSVLPGQGRSL